MHACYLLDDSLEFVRRWEDAKSKGFFTEEIKKELRESRCEHTLLINEAGDYELCPVREVKTEIENLHAFSFERGGAVYYSLCFVGDEIKLKLPIVRDKFKYLERDLKTEVNIDTSDDCVIIPVSNLRYIKSDISESEFVNILRKASVI